MSARSFPTLEDVVLMHGGQLEGHADRGAGVSNDIRRDESLPAEAVRRFHHLTFNDDLLHRCLAQVDQPQLAARQATFLVATYQGRQFDAALAVSRAYHELALNAEQVQRVGVHACSVLTEFGAAPEVLSAVWSVLSAAHEDLIDGRLDEALDDAAGAAQPQVPAELPVTTVVRRRRRSGSRLD